MGSPLQNIHDAPFFKIIQDDSTKHQLFMVFVLILGSLVIAAEIRSFIKKRFEKAHTNLTEFYDSNTQKQVKDFETTKDDIISTCMKLIEATQDAHASFKMAQLEKMQKINSESTGQNAILQEMQDDIRKSFNFKQRIFSEDRLSSVCEEKNILLLVMGDGWLETAKAFAENHLKGQNELYVNEGENTWCFQKTDGNGKWILRDDKNMADAEKDSETSFDRIRKTFDILKVVLVFVIDVGGQILSDSTNSYQQVFDLQKYQKLQRDFEFYHIVLKPGYNAERSEDDINRDVWCTPNIKAASNLTQGSASRKFLGSFIFKEKKGDEQRDSKAPISRNLVDNGKHQKIPEDWFTTGLIFSYEDAVQKSASIAQANKERNEIMC